MLPTTITLDTAVFRVTDIIALGWFLLLTLGYSAYADTRRSGGKRSIGTVMNHYRYLWMRQLLKRESRIMDAAIVGNLARNINFLASTSLLIVAGMLSALAYKERAVEVISTLPYTYPTTGLMWEVKLLLMILIFTYAFFKFTWALRTHSYTNIMIGAAPMPHEQPHLHDDYAKKASTVAVNAARHFNQGMRAFYFGLATLSWFVHPVILMITITWVIAVLYRREFRSNTLASLIGQEKNHVE
jgi:uncharacterized membrane protein